MVFNLPNFQEDICPRDGGDYMWAPLSRSGLLRNPHIIAGFPRIRGPFKGDVGAI